MKWMPVCLALAACMGATIRVLFKGAVHKQGKTMSAADSDAAVEEVTSTANPKECQPKQEEYGSKDTPTYGPEDFCVLKAFPDMRCRHNMKGGGDKASGRTSKCFNSEDANEITGKQFIDMNPKNLHMPLCCTTAAEEEKKEKEKKEKKEAAAAAAASATNEEMKEETEEEEAANEEKKEKEKEAAAAAAAPATAPLANEEQAGEQAAAAAEEAYEADEEADEAVEEDANEASGKENKKGSEAKEIKACVAGKAYNRGKTDGFCSHDGMICSHSVRTKETTDCFHSTRVQDPDAQQDQRRNKFDNSKTQMPLCCGPTGKEEKNRGK